MAETSAGHGAASISRSRIASWGAHVAQLSFGLWVLLSLATSSWRYGPFSWWPLWSFDRLAGGPVAVGLLNLLPLLAAAGWLARWLLTRDWHWSWGHPALTLPFLALSILGLLTLQPSLDRLTFIYGGGLLLTWLVYLVVLNERPALRLTLAAIILIQAVVASGQFLLQRDLGLVLLGELPLRPWWGGVSVLSARGESWLRGYGLLAHPNLLGAMLTALLLFLLPSLHSQRSEEGFVPRGLWKIVFAAGLLGLLVSFSRAAWLGMAAGCLLALWLHRRDERLRRAAGLRAWEWLWFLLPALLLLYFYHDLVLSRLLALDTPLEARSISERLRDAQLAVEVITRSPWRGVGLGHYVDAAALIDPAAARVHNATLLLTAELGIPGLSLWLVMAIAPFWLVWRGRLDPRGLPAWLAMLVVNLFDTTLWWGGNWQTAILFGLLLAHVHRPLSALRPLERGLGC